MYERFWITGAITMLAWLAPATAGAEARAFDALLQEALTHNPEIAGARAQSDAANLRIAPAGALEDPMLEVGIVNAPLPYNVRREDMTMKMLGLSQKLPYAGKRALRRAVAGADAAGIAHAVDETVDRVARDLRVSYEELRLAQTSGQLTRDTLDSLGQLAATGESRYSAGQASQGDVLLAQMQRTRMQQELLRLDQEQQQRRIELARLLGRQPTPDSALAEPIDTTPATMLDLPAPPLALAQAAQEHRPQLRALAAMIDKSEHELALARRERYPDFELRLNYGQRDRTPEGLPRDDMVTLTVAFNLPLWHSQRVEPRIAEALALRRQAQSLAAEQQFETQAGLADALAQERSQRASVALFRSTLQPQAAAALASALAAYRVGRADLATALEARMRSYEASLGEAEALARHNKAIAEIDFLTGRAPGAEPVQGTQP